MSNQPKKIDGVRLCLALTEDGLTAYGNPQAFEALAQWMTWLSNSDPSEHYECHATMALEDDASLFEGKRPRNVWALLSKKADSAFHLRSEHQPGFELTFLVVSESELDDMAKAQTSGFLPDGWGEAPSE